MPAMRDEIIPKETEENEAGNNGAYEDSRFIFNPGYTEDSDDHACCLLCTLL